MKKVAATVLLLFIIFPSHSSALPDYETGTVTWKFSGYAKSLSTVLQGAGTYEALDLTDHEFLYDNFSRVRFRSNAYLGKMLDFVVNYEIFNEVGDTQRLGKEAEDRFGDTPVGRKILDEALPDIRPPAFFNMDHVIYDGHDDRLRHRLDRLFVKLHAGKTDFTIGRAALTWGPGRIWNPTDYLASFSPTEIDKEEKIGIDMVYGRTALIPKITVEAFAAPVGSGNEIDVDRSAAAGRVSWRLLEADCSLSGGWLYDRWTAGADFDGLLFDAGLRGAVTATKAKDESEKTYVRGIADMDYGFGAAWNPYLMVEYYYNGYGETDADKYTELYGEPAFRDAYLRGDIFNVGRHYLGAMFSLQPHALVTVAETGIVNLTDASVYNTLAVTWSVIENLDLQAGAQNTFGYLPGEFSGLKNPLTDEYIEVPNIYFTYVKYYF